MPLQLAGMRVERKNAIGVKVVAAALVAIVVFAWIPRRPEQRIGFGIVCAGEPGCRRAVLYAIAFPSFRTLLAARRHRPKTPHFLPGFLVVRGQKAAHTFFAAGRPRNN